MMKLVYNDMKLMKIKKLLIIFLLALNCLSSACDLFIPDFADEDPLSIDSPIANVEYIFRSSPSTDGEVRVTGLDGSVVGDSTMVATNSTTNATVQATADSNGAFQFEIAASVGDTVIIEFDYSGVTDSFSFTASLSDPVPLDLEQTDLAVFATQNKTLVTVRGSSITSLVEINLTQRQVSNTYALTEAETGTPLTDLSMIEIFESSQLALIMDKTQLKFYILDLTTMTVKASPIAITGNFATIAAQNEVTMRASFNGVAETEALIRSTISNLMATYNSAISTTPDANTPLVLDGQISVDTTQLFIMATVGGNGILFNVEMQNSTLSINSQTSLVFPFSTVAGLGLYNSRANALIGDQTDLTGTGTLSRNVYVCDLTTMSISSTFTVEGTPRDIVMNSTQSDAYITLNTTHQVVKIETSSLTQTQTYDTGPNPTRLAIGASDDIVTPLNQADTTVSLIEL